MTGVTPPPADHNEQLLTYLAVWQQLLEKTMAMLGGPSVMATPGAIPGMPAGMSFPPPMAPGTPMPTVPPSPTDYAQQLFGYLQAWRQYLERVPGATTVPPQPAAAYPTTSPSSTPSFGSPQGYAAPDGGGGQPTPVGGSGEQTVPPPRGESLARTTRKQSTTKWPPEVLMPATEAGSQVPTSLFRLASEARLPQERGPGYERPEAQRPPLSDTPEVRPEGQSPRASSLARVENVIPERGEGINAEVHPRDFQGIQDLRG